MRYRALALLIVLAPTAHAEPPSGVDRIAALLPEKLAAVLHPVPPLGVRPGEDAVLSADKLAWMAELGRRVDTAHGFSRSVEWRALMGWAEGEMGLWPAAEPLDESIERYPVPGGRADPALDFRASVALAWLDTRRFSCQFPLRARFLARHGLTPSGLLPILRGGCPAFNRWIDPSSVDVEVLYVAQRWQDASATMGHLVFRLRKRPTEHVTGPSSELAFAYVAKDPPETPNYMWRGLTGGLRASVDIERFGDVWARYGIREGRDLHVFRLILSDEERLFFLAEVFAQSRHHMRVPYAFLTVNCATMAWDTLRALLPDLPPHDGLLVHPHEVVGMLLAAKRAVPRGTIPARKTLARDAEVARDAIELPSHPVFAQAHAARWRPPAARADALKALVVHLERPETLAAMSPQTLSAFTAWADFTLDIEAFSLDQKTLGYRPGATGPALEAALDLRAMLPPTASGSDEPIALVTAPTSGSHASGSRRAELAARVFAAKTPVFAVSWQTSVLDEQIGEPRLVVLSPAARMRLLVNELVVSFTPSGAAIERDRLVLVDALTLGDTVRTDNGWLASRLGFGFGAELASRPRDGLPFMVHVYGGPALTLAASRDFASHLALVLELDLASWTRVAHGDALFRATLGLGLEASIPLGTGRIRLRGRAASGFDLGGPVLELGARFAIEIPLITESGIHLHLTASWVHGQPLAAPWDTSIGVAF